jgi:2-oxo-4-hydroxy-4-carboxy-5-ureidoimidazoline decarboxylase
MAAWQRIDRAPVEEARVFLFTCCGSSRWVEQMLARRPFGNEQALVDAARTVWLGLAADDWREAFAHHPKIGDRESIRARFPSTAHLSTTEQSGMAGASEATLDALAEGNRAYEAKFGYIFIVCAAGKSAEEMLELLQARLSNDPANELLVAAGEQAKITALRLMRGAAGDGHEPRQP